MPNVNINTYLDHPRPLKLCTMNNQSQLMHIIRQVQYWRQLSPLIESALPQGGQWQVACYFNGILTISGNNQALICQVRYLQQHYIQRLKHVPAFQELKQLKVIIHQFPTQN